jgi:hypothetical protein
MTKTTTEKTYLTTAQESALIRKAYKAAGIKATVRTNTYSGGASINVRVISGNIDTAKQIANQYRNVSRCEVTGEILSGGNTYVFVEWADETINAKAAEIDAVCGSEIRALGEKQSVNVLNSSFAVIRGFGYDFHVCERTLDGLRNDRLAWDSSGAIKVLARIMLGEAA